VQTLFRAQQPPQCILPIRTLRATVSGREKKEVYGRLCVCRGVKREQFCFRIPDRHKLIARNYKQIRYRTPDIAFQDFRNRDVVNIVIANIRDLFIARVFSLSVDKSYCKIFVKKRKSTRAIRR